MQPRGKSFGGEMQEGWKGRKVVRLRDSPFAHRKRKKSQHPLFLQIHRNGEEGVAGPTPERPFPPLSLFFLVSFFRLRLSRKLTFRPFSFLPSSSPPSYTFPDKGKFRNERRGEKIPLQRLAVSTVVFPRKKTSDKYPYHDSTTTRQTHSKTHHQKK